MQIIGNAVYQNSFFPLTANGAAEILKKILFFTSEWKYHFTQITIRVPPPPGGVFLLIQIKTSMFRLLQKIREHMR